MLKAYIVYYRLYNRFVENESNKLYPWLFSLFLNIIFAFILCSYNKNIVLKIVPFTLFFLNIIVISIEKGDATKRFLNVVYTTPISARTVSYLNIICRVFSRDMVRWYILNIVVFFSLDVPWELSVLYFGRTFALLSFVPLIEYMFISKVTVRISKILFIMFFYFTLGIDYFQISKDYFDSFIFWGVPASFIFHMIFVDKLLAVNYDGRKDSDVSNRLHNILYVPFIRRVRDPIVRTIITLFFRDKKNLHDFTYMSLFVLCYALYLYKNDIYHLEFIIFYFVFVIHSFIHYQVKLKRRIGKVNRFLEFYDIKFCVIKKSLDYLVLFFNIKFTILFAIMYVFFMDFKWLFFIKIWIYSLLFSCFSVLMDVRKRRYTSFLKYVCCCLLIGSFVLILL